MWQLSSVLKVNTVNSLQPCPSFTLARRRKQRRAEPFFFFFFWILIAILWLLVVTCGVLKRRTCGLRLWKLFCHALQLVLWFQSLNSVWISAYYCQMFVSGFDLRGKLLWLKFLLCHANRSDLITLISEGQKISVAISNTSAICRTCWQRSLGWPWFCKEERHWEQRTRSPARNGEIWSLEAANSASEQSPSMKHTLCSKNLDSLLSLLTTGKLISPVVDHSHLK